MSSSIINYPGNQTFKYSKKLELVRWGFSKTTSSVLKILIKLWTKKGAFLRLFIAIDLPDWAKNELVQVRDPALGINWTSISTMHLTLRFVGGVDEKEDRLNLAQNLSAVDHGVFTFTLEDLGYFPPRSSPKVIWAGIKKNDELLDIQHKVEMACRSAGFKPETRTYKPHITIGRVKEASEEEVVSFIEQDKLLRLEEISVHEFVLYKSELHPDGAMHTPLERFTLESESGNYKG